MLGRRAPEVETPRRGVCTWMVRQRLARPCRRHRVCCDENKLPSLTKERNRQEHDHVWANLPTLSLAGIGETNETRETHETQNICCVFWGLQRKHEEYREVGVGLALPLTLFQVGSASVGGAYMPFCGMCAASVIECPRAWSPSSHTSQKTRCMRHP